MCESCRNRTHFRLDDHGVTIFPCRQTWWRHQTKQKSTNTTVTWFSNTHQSMPIIEHILHMFVSMCATFLPQTLVITKLNKHKKSFHACTLFARHFWVWYCHGARFHRCNDQNKIWQTQRQHGTLAPTIIKNHQEGSGHTICMRYTFMPQNLANATKETKFNKYSTTTWLSNKSFMLQNRHNQKDPLQNCAGLGDFFHFFSAKPETLILAIRL